MVKERLLCHAIIGKQSGKQRIMAVDVTCEFIAPVLQASSSQITFQVEKVSALSFRVPAGMLQSSLLGGSQGVAMGGIAPFGAFFGPT